MQMQNDTFADPVLDTVVVLGSKPNSVFPVVPARIVLTANAAVELALEYRKRYNSYIIAMVASEQSLMEHTYIQQAFIKGRPDEIVISSEDMDRVTSFIRNKLGLTESKIVELGFYERNMRFIDVVGWRKPVLVVHTLITRGALYFFRSVIPDLFGKRHLSWLSRSTGLNAAMYSVRRFPDIRKVIMAGIGLQAGNHFNGLGEFTGKTAKSDRRFMKYWSYQKRPWLYTTDDSMSTEGNIPLWRGDTFRL